MLKNWTYQVPRLRATRARAGSAGSTPAAPARPAGPPRSGRRRSCGSSCCRACARRRTARRRRSSPAGRTRASRRCGGRDRRGTAPSRRPLPRRRRGSRPAPWAGACCCARGCSARSIASSRGIALTLRPPVPFMPRVSFDAAENRKQLNRPTRPDRRVCRVWGCGIPRSRHERARSPERVRVRPAGRPHPRSVRYGSVAAAGGRLPPPSAAVASAASASRLPRLPPLPPRLPLHQPLPAPLPPPSGQQRAFSSGVEQVGSSSAAASASAGVSS